MRIKFEIDLNGICKTVCEKPGVYFPLPVKVGTILCVRKCPHYRGTEGNEVICWREGKE